MDEDRIRKELQDKLLDHETSIDVEAVWAGIDQQQGRKRRGLWLFFAAGLLCLSAVAYIFVGGQDSRGLTSNEKLEDDQFADQLVLKSDQQQEKGQEKIDEEIELNSAIKEEDLVHQKHSRKQEKNTQPQNNRTNFNTKSKNTSATATTKATSGSQNKELASLESNIMPSKPLVNVVQNKSSLLSATLNKSSVPAPILSNKLEKPTAVFTPPSNSNSQEILKLAQVPGLFMLMETNNRLSVLPAKLKWTKYPQISKRSKRKSKSKSNQGSWRLTGALYSGVFINNKKLSSLGEINTYQIEREKSETPLETISLGFQLKAKSSTGFVLYTGIEVIQMTEKFEFERQLNITENASFQSRIYLRNIEKRIYNKLRLVEIPVGVGYQISRNKWGVELNAGLAYNLALNAQGQLLDQEIMPVDLSQLALYKSKVGLSYHGLVAINYNWTDRLQSSMGFKYTHYANSFNLEFSGTDERHKLIGLQLGTAYRF